jgi:metal-sulfur cluster biosynthetic enzyme
MMSVYITKKSKNLTMCMTVDKCSTTDLIEDQISAAASRISICNNVKTCLNVRAGPLL